MYPLEIMKKQSIIEKRLKRFLKGETMITTCDETTRFDNGVEITRSRPAFYKGNKINGYKMYEGQTDTIAYANPIVRMHKCYLNGTGHYNIVLECPIFV